MNIKSRNFNPAQYGVQKFQEGGEMAAPAEAPVEEAAPAQGGEDPMQQLLMACQQALETQDCNLAMQVCQAFLQLAGGGGEPAPAAPEGQAPVYKMGGRLAYWKKN